jgi:hypothetical protein
MVVRPAPSFQRTMNIGRRKFLVRATAATALYVTNGAGPFSAAANEELKDGKDSPKPCPAASWTKKGIVLQPDEPWEDQFIDASLSTVQPLENGRWRIWYAANAPRSNGVAGIAIAEGVPGERFVKHRALLSDGQAERAALSIGNLPRGWKPALPTYLRLADGRHRLYFFAYGRQGKQSVQRYLAADSDDGRRYRVLDPERPCLYSVWDNTKDKKFLPGQKLEDILTNDVATVYQLPDGSFEMFVQSLEKIGTDDPRYVAHDNLKGWVRSIDRFTSDDGVRFDRRQRKVLAPDHDDPVDTQFYHLAVTHTAQGRVGLLGWYRVGDGTMELQYAFSRDGLNWSRTRRPWINRGKAGEADSMTIYPPTSLVYHDNKWWLFYSAGNYTHSTLQTARPGEINRSVVMLATTPSLWQR